jgi:hypothetical protein
MALALSVGGSLSANADVIGPWTTAKPNEVVFRAGGEQVKLTATHLGTEKQVIDRFWKQKAYVHWRVRFVSGGHVRYAAKMNWTRLDIVARIFANGPQTDSTPHLDGFRGSVRFSADEFRRILRHLDDSSTSQLSAEVRAYSAESGAEDQLMYGANGEVWDAASRWAKQHDYPATFDGFVMPTPQGSSASGATFELSGTPHRPVATATMPNGVWVRLTGLTDHGVLGPYPSTSKDAALATSAWRWIFRHA